MKKKLMLLCLLAGITVIPGYCVEITVNSGETVTGDIVKIAKNKYCIVQAQDGTIKKVISDQIKDVINISETEKQFLGINTNLLLGINFNNFIPSNADFKTSYGENIVYPELDFVFENILPYFDITADIGMLSKSAAVTDYITPVNKTLTVSGGYTVDEKTDILSATSKINIMPVTIGLRYSTIICHKFSPYIGINIGPYVIEESMSYQEKVTVTHGNNVADPKANTIETYNRVENSNTVSDTNLGYQLRAGIVIPITKNIFTRIELMQSAINSKGVDLGGNSAGLNISYIFRYKKI